jgi:hypothetical protein
MRRGLKRSIERSKNRRWQRKRDRCYNIVRRIKFLYRSRDNF